MTVAKYEPVIREEYFKAKNFSKEGYLSFRYRSPCEGWLYLPPLPTRIQASSVVSFVLSGSTAALAVQGPVVYLAPRLQVAVQGPEVVGSAAASGSARTCFVPGSTAASGSARTRGSWIHDCKWQCKDQLLYLAPRLKADCLEEEEAPRLR
jgi:hypothetical protein